MFSLPFWLLSSSVAYLATLATAKPCVGFDASWNGYVFGLDHDVSIGPSSNWNASPLGMNNLTKTGRPPFNGGNTQCFFSQFQNALYVIDADTSQPSNIHIFSFDSQSWSTQGIGAGGTDPNTLVAILDRDTNVFFALSDSVIYQLDMGNLAAADGGTRTWYAVQAPPFAQNNAYPSPVLALAENHVHFLNTGTPGSVDIFVIHFAFVQPDPQVFAPLENGGPAFPSTHGQTASIFEDLPAVQQRFAFIPDDGSATYIFDAIANTTQLIQAPPIKDTVMIASSPTELVQMTKSGDVYWLSISQDNAQANYGATWSKLPLGIPLATVHNNTNGTNSTNNGSNSSGTHTGTAPVPSNTTSAALRNINDNSSLGIFMALLGLCGICALF